MQEKRRERKRKSAAACLLLSVVCLFLCRRLPAAAGSCQIEPTTESAHPKPTPTSVRLSYYSVNGEDVVTGLPSSSSSLSFSRFLFSISRSSQPTSLLNSSSAFCLFACRALPLLLCPSSSRCLERIPHYCFCSAPSVRLTDAHLMVVDALFAIRNLCSQSVCACVSVCVHNTNTSTSTSTSLPRRRRRKFLLEANKKRSRRQTARRRDGGTHSHRRSRAFYFSFPFPNTETEVEVKLLKKTKKKRAALLPIAE